MNTVQAILNASGNTFSENLSAKQFLTDGSMRLYGLDTVHIRVKMRQAFRQKMASFHLIFSVLFGPWSYDAGLTPYSISYPNLNPLQTFCAKFMTPIISPNEGNGSAHFLSSWLCEACGHSRHQVFTSHRLSRMSEKENSAGSITESINDATVRLDKLPEPGSPERLLAERKLVRRLDMRLLPTIFLIFIMNYIDVCVFLTVDGTGTTYFSTIFFSEMGSQRQD